VEEKRFKDLIVELLSVFEISIFLIIIMLIYHSVISNIFIAFILLFIFYKKKTRLCR